ncbi:putative leucine-rich repeat receptor-like serine/threonine-protein kinase [Nymphaea thermarum]|nr:putative leucine-rich repeat receptor-like serine/threonine-protein kinase [Nymphaea thermarum]
MVSRGGLFESLDITSFLDNPLLCELISGLLRCPKNKRQVSPFHSKKNFALMLATSASATFLATTICCSVCCSLLKKVVFIARDRIDVRCNIPQPQESKFPRRLIGTGSYGEVYRGELKDGREVAIKVLKMQGKNSSKSFNRECQVLKNIRHRNLMRSQPDFKALVLTFMAKGSLESHLHPSSDLSLIRRVTICSDDRGATMTRVGHRRTSPTRRRTTTGEPLLRMNIRTEINRMPQLVTMTTTPNRTMPSPWSTANKG